MQDIDKTITSRAFSKAAKWQIIITAGLTLGFLPVAGVHAALSALAGGVSVILGAFVAMKMVATNKSAEPSGVLVSLLKAEAIKIAVVAAFLFCVFKYYQGLVPLSLIGGLAGSALASGAGLRSVNNEKIKVWDVY